MNQGGPREIEVKFRVEDREAFEACLAVAGAAPGPTLFESNALLDDDRASLRSRGHALRVRALEDSRDHTRLGGLLTLKGPATMRSGVKSRLELETGVDSPGRTLDIFGMLGYTPRFRYEKRRTEWRFQDSGRPVVVLDDTPLGLFAEIEGDEASLRALARELGVSEDRFLSASYASLWEQARRLEPSLPFHMVFPEE